MITWINLILYGYWRLLGINLFTTIAVILTVIILFKKLIKDEEKDSNRDIFRWIETVIIGINVMMIAVVLYPYVAKISVNNFVSLGLSSVTDMYKHSYVITAIKEFGLPPKHPYFPEAGFSYYYGYYLIPSFFSRLLPYWQNIILFLYILATDFLALLIIRNVIHKFIKTGFVRLTALLSVVWGMGLDIIPMFIDKVLSKPSLIEMWSITNQLGLRIDNTYVSLLWAPQHFLAASLTLWVIIKINENRINLWRDGAIMAFICLSSVFVAIGMGMALVFIFLNKPEIRKKVGLMSMGVILLLMPYILDNIGRGKGLFSIYRPMPFNFWEGQDIFNYMASLVVEYGSLMVMLPVIVFWSKNNIKLNWLWLKIIYLPVMLTWFIRSAGYNDLALRITILSQLLAVLVFFNIWESLKQRIIKIITGILIVINLFLSLTGLGYEYTSRWKMRQILDPYESELILKLRQINNRESFAANGKGEWIFKIPPLAFKPVFTSDLYDSGAYLTDNPNKTFGKYESMEKRIFYRQNQGSSMEEIIESRNKEFTEIYKYFAEYDYDWILFDNRIGVKNGKNPWVNLLNKLEVESWRITPVFTAYRRQSILKKLEQNQIVVDGSVIEEFKITDNKFIMPAGVWYVAACNDSGIIKTFRFEPEDGYKVFENDLKNGECLGNLYYLERQTEVKLAGNTLLKTNIYPINLLK